MVNTTLPATLTLNCTCVCSLVWHRPCQATIEGSTPARPEHPKQTSGNASHSVLGAAHPEEDMTLGGSEGAPPKPNQATAPRQVVRAHHSSHLGDDERHVQRNTRRPEDGRERKHLIQRSSNSAHRIRSAIYVTHAR